MEADLAESTSDVRTDGPEKPVDEPSSSSSSQVNNLGSASRSPGANVQEPCVSSMVRALNQLLLAVLRVAKGLDSPSADVIGNKKAATKNQSLGSRDKTMPEYGDNLAAQNISSDSTRPDDDLEILAPSNDNLRIALKYIDPSVAAVEEEIVKDDRYFTVSGTVIDHLLPTERHYVALLAAWNKQTNEVYAKILNDVIAAYLNRSMTATHRLALGQVFVVYAVESPRASEIVELIMTQLDPETQLDLQEVIEQYQQNHSDRTTTTTTTTHNRPDILQPYSEEVVADNQPSSVFQSADKVPPPVISKRPVPPLSLNRLGNAPSKEATNSGVLFSARYWSQDSDSDPHDYDDKNIRGVHPVQEHHTHRDVHTDDDRSSHQGEDTINRGFSTFHDISVDYAAEARLWKQKYESLKAALNDAENAREALAARCEQAMKDLDDQKHVQEAWLAQQRRNDTAVAKTSAVEVMDLLEQEVVGLKESLERLAREKKEAEKELRSQLHTLRDENQLLLADSAKLSKLQASADKYKARIEELTTVKTRNQQLERQVQTYLDRVVNLEEELKGAAEIKRSLEIYKTKVTELEADHVELTAHYDEAQKKITALSAAVEDATKKRSIAELRVQAIEADYQARLSEMATSNTDGLSEMENDKFRERVARLEKENELLRHGEQHQTMDRVIELEHQLDDTRRLKDVLEKQYKALVTKMTLQEAEQGGTSAEAAEQATKLILAEKTNELLVQKAELQAVQNEKDRLTAELEHEKTKMRLLEESIGARLESKYDTVITTLKKQIQLREQELKFIYLARNEQLAVHRREERLMSAAFHELGAQYFQLKLERDRVSQEYEAAILKIQKRKSVGKTGKEGSSPIATPRDSLSHSR